MLERVQKLSRKTKVRRLSSLPSSASPRDTFLRLNTAVAQVTVMANNAFRYATIAQIQQHLAAGGPALETYADVGSNHRTVIHFAAFDNNVDKLVWCIDHGGVPVNATAANGDTPLVDAVAQGSIEAAKALMMRGGTPGVNVLKQRAEREFERAVQRDQRFPNNRFNQERLVKAARMDAFLDGVLYSTGQPPLPPLPPSATALQGAVHGGHTAVVQLLLQQGADPASALDLAQAIGNQEIIALLTANQ